jgi:hypothetical protein
VPDIDEGKWMQMLELAPYGLTGLIEILVVAVCFAYKDDSSRSMDDAQLRHPKGVERCTCTADPDSDSRGRQQEEALNG